MSLDQLANTLLLGDPDETISSRVGKKAAKKHGWFPCIFCKFLDLFDPNHCAKNIEADEGDI